MNMTKYFFILRAQILLKNCRLLGRSLLRRLMQNRNSSDLLGSGGSTNTRSLFYDSGLANTNTHTTGVDL